MISKKNRLTLKLRNRSCNRPIKLYLINEIIYSRANISNCNRNILIDPHYFHQRDTRVMQSCCHTISRGYVYA